MRALEWRGRTRAGVGLPENSVEFVGGAQGGDVVAGSLGPGVEFLA